MTHLDAYKYLIQDVNHLENSKRPMNNTVLTFKVACKIKNSQLRSLFCANEKKTKLSMGSQEYLVLEKPLRKTQLPQSLISKQLYWESVNEQSTVGWDRRAKMITFVS